MEERLMLLALAVIIPGDNDRTAFAPEGIRELAESIAEHGLAEPIIVRPWGEGRYQIVAGERRYRAHRLLAEEGRLDPPVIKALVRAYNDEQAAAIMLAENVHREDLNPLDEARAYQKRMAQFGWSVAQVAERANVSATRVRSRLALLELTEDVQHLVAQGSLPLGHAAEMAVLDVNRQRMALAWLRDQPAMPTRAAFARIVGELYEQQAQDALFDMDALFKEVMVVIDESDTGELKDILPKREGLPDLPDKASSVGYILDAYVAELLRGGFEGEAGVLMDFWVKLQGANVGRIPSIESQALALLCSSER